MNGKYAPNSGAAASASQREVRQTLDEQVRRRSRAAPTASSSVPTVMLQARLRRCSRCERRRTTPVAREQHRRIDADIAQAARPAFEQSPRLRARARDLRLSAGCSSVDCSSLLRPDDEQRSTRRGRCARTSDEGDERRSAMRPRLTPPTFTCSNMSAGSWMPAAAQPLAALRPDAGRAEPPDHLAVRRRCPSARTRRCPAS